jgi:serine/threonine protein kinase
VIASRVALHVESLGNATPTAQTRRHVASTRTRIVGTTRIEEAIGQGGMAQVYRGEQRGLGRRVAIKLMLPKIARDRDMVLRFRREARTLASLQHENIVAVHDLIEKNGQVFMVLEYVEGIDVGELAVGGKALPLDIALIIATGVARALEHAHFRRIIHRDIKPANVMISRRGEVKLADFGIAKDLDEADLTRTGFVVGTPSFLAPEVLQGQRADHRVDIYAVGVLLFQLLTGKKPFAIKDPKELFAAVISGKREKVRALAPDCPRATEKIVDRCLERDREARYARAADLRKDLEVQLNGVLDGNPTARMVGFLFGRGVARAEDLATLDIAELKQADPTIDLSGLDLSARSIEVDLEDPTGDPEEPPPRRRGRMLAWLSLLVVAGLALGYALAPPELVAEMRRTVERAISSD